MCIFKKDDFIFYHFCFIFKQKKKGMASSNKLFITLLSQILIVPQGIDRMYLSFKKYSSKLL